MTNQEFQLWWDHAVVVIPSLADWAAKIRKHPDKNFDKIIEFWTDRFSRVGLSAAKDAIESLAQSEMPKYNRDFDSIPFRIKSMLAEPATMSPGRQFTDGQETVKCLTCNDEGFITIWHDIAVVAMRKGEFEKVRPYTCAVRCTCDAGHAKSKNITMFDSSQHCVAVNVYGEGLEVLRESCNPHNRAKEMAGYDPSLAGFNEEPF